MAYDGLDVLIKALENDGGLVNHLVENTLFFHPDIVARQAAEMNMQRTLPQGSKQKGERTRATHEVQLSFLFVSF